MPCYIQIWDRPDSIKKEHVVFSHLTFCDRTLKRTNYLLCWLLHLILKVKLKGVSRMGVDVFALAGTLAWQDSHEFFSISKPWGHEQMLQKWLMIKKNKMWWVTEFVCHACVVTYFTPVIQMAIKIIIGCSKDCL